MEVTYMYENALVMHSKSVEMVGISSKWKISRKRKSCLIKFTMNTSLFFARNHYYTLFSWIKLYFFFFFFQTTKMNLKWHTTLQQPWTNWLASTMWTLVKVKTVLDEFFGPKFLPTTWMWNSNCSRKMKTKIFAWHKTWQWERQILISFYDRGISWLFQSDTLAKKKIYPLCKWNY